mgnify:CR=1 FL=1
MSEQNQRIRDAVKDTLIEIGAYLEGVDENIDNDINMQDYLRDSIQFISFVVLLEEKLGITIPDELLMYDSIASFSAFCLELENITDA